MNDGIELLKVSEYATNQFKRFVRGAWNLSNEEVRKKLHRNFILGVSIPLTEPEVECRAFGQLYIYIKDYEVIKISACRGRCKSEVFINKREKEDLNKLLGIGEVM